MKSKDRNLSAKFLNTLPVSQISGIPEYVMFYYNSVAVSVYKVDYYVTATFTTVF